MAKNCANHKDAPSIGICAQCGKPMCQSCTMITPLGQFCSTQCSVVHREMKKLSGGPKKSSAGLKMVFLLLLVVAAAFGIHFAALSKREEPDHWLKKIDVIGRLLERQER